MPARNRFDEQFEEFQSSTERTREICKLQTEALRQIVCAEVSLDGGIAMKYIAEQALLESVRILHEAPEVEYA